MYKYLFIFILFIFCNSLIAQTSTPPAIGDGSIGIPYQIATLENLYWLSQQEGNSDATGLYWSRNYLQTADINASNTTTWGSGNGNSGWVPIGTYSNNFAGKYDGQNYSISYLYINRWDEGGLFGHLNSSADIQNINLTFINLVSPNYSGGAIASYNNGTITNCSATGTITTQRFPGGLVGHNDTNGTISNSNTTVAVTATGDGFSTFNGPAGFVGDNSGTITNCYSTDAVNGWGSAGGFVHNNSYSGNISLCYTTSVVNGGTDSGGFVGINTGGINACFSTGVVYSGGQRVGGFVGEAGDTGNGSITNCYSLGDVTRNTGSTQTTYGAFAGRANGTIAYCYTIGSVTYTDGGTATDKGFVGLDNTGLYDSNFWDFGASNQLTATGATAKSTADMQTLCTFTDDATVGLSTPVWDFETNPNDDVANDDDWDMDLTKTINTGYPFLSWENGTAIALPVGVEPAGSPRQVSTLEHLLWISENSSSWGDAFEQTADIDASSTNIWNCGEGFLTIGNTSPYFTGSYDGQGFTIDGLYIDREDDSYIGFIGEAEGATIQNLGVTNVDITGRDHVGGLVAEIWSSSTVNNCYSTGSVSGTHDYVGGLTGRIYASDLSICYSTGMVSGSNVVGGLVGENYGSTVSNCYSRGDVTRSSGTDTDFGAFCGHNQATIEYCYSTGSVYYSGDTDPTDKGFVGVNSGTPTYTNNFWDSEASNQTSAYGATLKSTAAMKDVATFTLLSIGDLSAPVWDFETNPNDDAANENYWDMDYSAPGKVRSLGKIAAINSGYPFLSWENGEEISLPVELSSFTVEATNQGVLCSWTTESETENLGFILERKTEATNWIEIASYKTDDGLLGQGSVTSATNYEFLDVFVEPNTTYEYRLGDVDYYGVVTYHATREVSVEMTPLEVVEGFTVLPAYPNPFNPSTTITYGIDTDSKITVQIYDITGQLITTILNTEQTQGWHSVVWNGTNQHGKQAPAGLYISRITSNNEVKTNKLMLLK